MLRHALGGDALVEGLEDPEALVVGGFGRDHALEDAEDAVEVPARDHIGARARQVGLQEADQRRDVPWALPEQRGQERPEEGVHVDRRQRGLPRLDQLAEDLEHVGRKLLDVLLQHDLEGREQRLLEVCHSRGVAGAA